MAELYLRDPETDDLQMIGSTSCEPVQKLIEIFDDFPVVTAELIVAAHTAMKTDNTTTYSIADADEVASWLGDHFGKRIELESL